MRCTLFLAFVLGLFPACQVSDRDNSFRTEFSPEGAAMRGNVAILGDWQGLPATALSDGTARDVLRIESDALSAVRTCEFEDGTEITVTAKADAEIQQKNITVFQAVEVTEQVGIHTCTATIDAGVLVYGIVTDQMRVLVDGEVHTLTRAQ
jgi:hypothetical protein